jgi:hypothetical protein
MELSSPRFKALAVTTGISFWFFIISSAADLFTIEIMFFVIAGIGVITQIFAFKISKVLNVFAIVNTKIFLGLLFIFVISLYGIIFKILKIDVLRLKRENKTYWLETEKINSDGVIKQY